MVSESGGVALKVLNFNNWFLVTAALANLIVDSNVMYMSGIRL